MPTARNVHVSFANLWLGVREDANDNIREYLNWDEETDGPYTGPVPERAQTIFDFLSQHTHGMFPPQTIGPNEWYLYNLPIYIKNKNLSELGDEIDWLVTTYGNMVQVGGAWKYTGEQFGTEHVYDTRLVDKWVTQKNPDYDPNEFLEDGTTPNPAYDPEQYIRVWVTDIEETYISGMSGTPIYPIPHSVILNFMPDVGDPPVPATELTDINLLFGQDPRSFF